MNPLNLIRKAIYQMGEWYARNGYPRLAAAWGFGPRSYAGRTITVESALTCSIVWVCSKVVVEPLSSMPLNLLRKKGDSTSDASDSPLYKVLKFRPNEYQTPRVFRQTLTHHALNYGDGLAEIVRNPSGQVIGLHCIHPTRLKKVEIKNYGLIYTLTPESGSGPDEVLPGKNVFHLKGFSDDGLRGMGAIAQGKQSIALAMAAEEYGARFLGRGGTPPGMLRKLIPFSDQAKRQEFRDEFDKIYQNIEESHKTLMLEGDWDFKAFGFTPEQSQLLLLRQFQIADVARYYNLSPHLANDLSRATFSNIEQLHLEFVNFTEMPWAIAWEQEIYRSLLTDEERKAGFYAKHNFNAFLRGDFETRMRGYSMALQNGINSINEVRAREDEDPVEGGDAHHIQLNMQTVPGTGTATTAQASQLVKVSDGKKGHSLPKPEPMRLADPIVEQPKVYVLRKMVLRDDHGDVAGVEETIVNGCGRPN